jgi:hypothetical protein
MVSKIRETACKKSADLGEINLPSDPLVCRTFQLADFFTLYSRDSARPYGPQPDFTQTSLQTIQNTHQKKALDILVT